MLASDPDWKGSKYNVQVEWETGEITFEPLSIIAADDPVTCAAYVRTGPPVGEGIGSLPVTPKINGEIGAMCVESGLAGVAQHNKTYGVNE